MDHLSAAGSSATRNLTTTEPPKSPNRRKTVNFRFQRPHATSRSFFFNKPMRAMDSRRNFTPKKVFPGYFSELGEKLTGAHRWWVQFGLKCQPRKALGVWPRLLLAKNWTAASRCFVCTPTYSFSRHPEVRRSNRINVLTPGRIEDTPEFGLKIGVS